MLRVLSGTKPGGIQVQGSRPLPTIINAFYYYFTFSFNDGPYVGVHDVNLHVFDWRYCSLASRLAVHMQAKTNLTVTHP